MRIALVSGDGLPVSGLLTIFRNVLEAGRILGRIDLPVPADLGYAWRPDKPEYFPAGGQHPVHPDWMTVCDLRLPVPCVRALGEELASIREGVAAYDTLDDDGRRLLSKRVEALSEKYEARFAAWLDEHRPDWVIALNMTLSDAVPATLGLHRAVDAYFAGDRPGGIVFWDHDLFGSCAIPDPETGARIYPELPNRLVPVPQDNAHTRWIVISEALARETAAYATTAVPGIVTNLLPTVPEGPPEERHLAFLRHHDLAADRPLLLDPVRVFQVKGVDLALRLHAETKAAALASGRPVPYLLVFGGLDEEPDYARDVLRLCADLRIEEDVRFLDGVPLSTFQDQDGCWHLDEKDLLRFAAASSGGVVFTPGVPDVETMGLGPGLAAVAKLPCVVTDYDAFLPVYGPDLWCLRMGTDPDGVRAAAHELLRVLDDLRTGAPRLRERLAANRAAVEARFPIAPWERFWRDLEKVTP